VNWDRLLSKVGRTVILMTRWWSERICIPIAPMASRRSASCTIANSKEHWSWFKEPPNSSLNPGHSHNIQRKWQSHQSWTRSDAIGCDSIQLNWMQLNQRQNKSPKQKLKKITCSMWPKTWCMTHEDFFAYPLMRWYSKWLLHFSPLLLDPAKNQPHSQFLVCTCNVEKFEGDIRTPPRFREQIVGTTAERHGNIWASLLQI
jgi:hypothetical protein